MKKFHFPMDTILNMRLREEEQIKQELAEKNMQIVEARKDLNSVHDELRNLQTSEKQNRSSAHDVTALRYSVTFRYKLKSDILEAARKIQDLGAEAIQVQKKLIAATQKRRAIEIIKERRLQEWKKAYMVKEQGFIDEISQQTYIRRIHSRNIRQK